MHHTFLYISFPFLHHYDVKMPFFDVNKQRRNFISLSQELGKSDLDLKVPYGYGQLQAGVLFPPHRLLLLYFSALFKNTRILKFKSQLPLFALFAVENHLSGPLKKQNFTLTGSKGRGL